MLGFALKLTGKKRFWFHYMCILEAEHNCTLCNMEFWFPAEAAADCKSDHQTHVTATSRKPHFLDSDRGCQVTGTWVQSAFNIRLSGGSMLQKQHPTRTTTRSHEPQGVDRTHKKGRWKFCMCVAEKCFGKRQEGQQNKIDQMWKGPQPMCLCMNLNNTFQK